MPLTYRTIEVYTSEEARWRGHPVWEAVVEVVRNAGTTARCVVLKGVAGTYETGEQATGRLEVLSYHLPVKVEIIVPDADCDRILAQLEPVVSDGILAVRDTRVVIHRVKQRLIPLRLKVRDVMTSQPTAVAEATPVSDVIRILITADFNAVPVVNRQRRPVGIITQGDLVNRGQMPIRLGLLAELEEAQLDGYLAGVSHLSAADVMTRPVVTVEADDLLDHAVKRMLRQDLKRFPVVDGKGKLVGMLARLDVFGTIARHSANRRVLEARDVDLARPVLVSDIMSRERATVAPQATGAEVLQVLRSQGVQRLVVVDGEGRLLGLITDSDLLSALTSRKGGFWDYLSRRADMEEVARSKTAAEIMKTELITVTETTPVEEAVRLMSEHGLKRLPVTSEGGKFEGMVSRQAVLAAGAVWDA